MNLFWILGGYFAFVIVLALLSYSVFKYSNKNRKLESTVFNLIAENAKVVSQRKSSEVRLGKIGENMAPFFGGWPYDPNGFRFLGNPIDGIQFTNEAVIFVEIKTGNARLTDSQKTVKKLVKEGKVKFATFRVDEGGCTLKVEEDDSES